MAGLDITSCFIADELWIFLLSEWVCCVWRRMRTHFLLSRLLVFMLSVKQQLLALGNAAHLISPLVYCDHLTEVHNMRVPEA